MMMKFKITSGIK